MGDPNPSSKKEVADDKRKSEGSVMGIGKSDRSYYQ